MLMREIDEDASQPKDDEGHRSREGVWEGRVGEAEER